MILMCSGVNIKEALFALSYLEINFKRNVKNNY